MRRLLALAAPGRRRFFTACGVGVLAVGCGVGLIASAAWLISAASLHPHIAALTVAIVGVRVFALGKAALRYLERLVSHDIAFRMLADIRTRFVAALEPLSPGALPVYHRGDLLSRMVSDVDGLQDLPLRVRRNRSLSRPELPHWLSVSSRPCSPRRPLSWLYRSRSQRSRHRP